MRRLKEPRYLIGAIVGLGYLWTVFLRHASSNTAGGALSQTSSARLSLELGGAAFLFFVAASACIPFPTKRSPALNFSQADVQFLFPAPFSRKELLQYRLIRAQIPILFSSAFTTIVFRRASLAQGWMVFAGMALIFTILNLYLTGLSLYAADMRAHRKLAAALAAGAAIILGVTVAHDWGTLSSLPVDKNIILELDRLASTGPAGMVMWPFRALTRLPLARTPLEFLRALPGPAVLLVLNYLWVIRSKASFEEGSAELADRMARVRKGQPLAPRNGAVRQTAAVRPTPFPLSLDGRPETAILWKNLIAVGRNFFSIKTFLFVALFVGGGIGIGFANFIATRGSRGGGGAAMLGGLCAMIYVFTLLMGPQIARNDLRRDLVNLDVLKTWPISGAALVRGEVMAPAALLTMIAWLCAVGGFIFAATLKVQPSWIVAAALFAPAIILLQLLAQNAIAVMWPAWASVGPTRPRGIDVMGQRLLMMVGLTLGLAVAVLPAAAIALVAGFVIHLLLGGFPIVAPAMIAVAVLFAEAFALSEAIGRLLDRTDISATDPLE